LSAWERTLDNLRPIPGTDSFRGSRGKTRLPNTTPAGVSRGTAGFVPDWAERQGLDNPAPVAPQRPPPVPGGISGTTTNPGDPSQFEPDPYPTVLPSLSAQQLGQLAERRMLADMRLKQAETEAKRRKELLEASSVRAREEANRTKTRNLQDFMREAGGKGLARSPMVAGRQVRREGEDLRLKYGEIDTRLSTEIAALQDLVSKAADERQFVISSTEQQEIDMRADLERLFPAASMFR